MHRGLHTRDGRDAPVGSSRRLCFTGGWSVITIVAVEEDRLRMSMWVDFWPVLLDG